jgi:uncharacterized protein YbbC (DUF1343 family)
MMSAADAFLVDLQDLGCRIYTFVITLLYLLEAASGTGTSVWVLDRRNPVGRPIEGLRLREGWEGFVGAGPLPMRHGLTLGELGHWFIDHFRLDVDYRVEDVAPWAAHERAQGFGIGVDLQAVVATATPVPHRGVPREAFTQRS